MPLLTLLPTALARTAIWLSLAGLAACERSPVGPGSATQSTGSPSSGVQSALASSVQSAPAPRAQPACSEFPRLPEWGDGGNESVRLELRPPSEARTVELRAKGVTLSFGFDAFLLAAKCLQRPLAVDYLERRRPTEMVVTITTSDEQQLLFVAAALLDLGKASAVDERTQQTAATAVKDHWAWMGCGGGCRHLGREYRLSVPGEVFFQITDKIAHGRPVPVDPSEAR